MTNTRKFDIRMADGENIEKPYVSVLWFRNLEIEEVIRLLELAYDHGHCCIVTESHSAV